MGLVSYPPPIEAAVISYKDKSRQVSLRSSTEDEAFDNSIMQKILPRIQGSSAFIKDMLCELFESLSGQNIDANAADTTTAAAMQRIIDGGTIKCPKSAAKIKFMVQRFEEDGFTSYWL